jgi:hypothetical protein
MTTRSPRYDLDAAAPQRWRIGLFEGAGAVPLTAEALNRLVGGIEYVPLDPGVTLNNASFDPCDYTTLNGEAVADNDECGIQWNAWGIALGEEISTLNGDDGRLEDVEARARARMEAQTSYLGEYTFWSGNVGTTDFATLTWPNIALTDDTSAAANFTDLTPTDGEAGPVEAFGLINEYLSDTLRGLRGMIHVSPQTLPYLSNYRLAVRDGFVLGTTLGDHIIVAGSGYQGTGPGNEAQPNNRTWIYATSMVRVGASAIEVRSAYDRANNQAKAIAFRTVLAEWDLVAHAGVRVCLTDPGPTCADAGS